MEAVDFPWGWWTTTHFRERELSQGKELKIEVFMFFMEKY